MEINSAIENYKSYLVIEKRLTENSIGAYLSDIKKLAEYTASEGVTTIEDITSEKIQIYVRENSSVNSRTLARLTSTLRSFFEYLTFNGDLETNPASILESPKLVRKIPNILSEEEVKLIQSAVEMYKPESLRNKAMIETLYSCGLRVSELIELKISNINFRRSSLKIEGKGNKERIISLSKTAKEEIQNYLKGYRDYLNIQKGYEDILFLNNRGKSLSRVMVFNIIKQLAQRAGINKSVSPHTFRHSFATHLINGGTDLMTVQNMLGHESILTTEIYTRINKS